MSNIRTLMIEGFPQCFGTGAKPSWYEGVKIDALGDSRDRPTITRHIDPMGGVEEVDDVTFKLVDTAGSPGDLSYTLAKTFRFLGQNTVGITGPDPILYNETTLEADGTSYVAGDLLYLPSDTVRVTGVDAGAGEIFVERGVFSCLENTYKAYYAKLPYNDLVCTAHEDYPQHYPGRIVAYYEGGHEPKHLKYIGFLRRITQRGKGWNIATEHILKPLLNGFNPIQTDIALKTEGGNGYWWVTNPRFFAEDGDGALHSITYAMSGGYSRSILFTELDPSSLSIKWGFQESHAYRYQGDSAPQFMISKSTQGIHDAFFDHESFHMWNGNLYFSLTEPVPKYGFIYGHETGITTEYMEIELDYANPWNLTGGWLKAGKYYLKIEEITAGGVLRLGGPYDEDLNYLPGQTFAVTSDYPVRFTTAPIVEKWNLLSMIYSLLMSTGVGDNSVYDSLPGYMGLGLPEEIVNTLGYVNFTGEWPVFCDISEATISDDLKMIGRSLIWDINAGEFKFTAIEAPVTTLITNSIDTADISIRERLTVDWGFISPVSSFSYKMADGTLNITAQISNYWPGAVLKGVSIETQTGAKMANAELFRTSILKRLQWLSNYAPTIQLDIPKNTYNLGDLLRLTLKNVAGQGNYHAKDVPSIVIAKTVGPNTDHLTLMVNTANTALNAGWVPSWEIESYTGAVITLKKGGALRIAERYTLPLTIQIIDSLGAILDASFTIDSVTGDKTLTLSGTPTYSRTIYIGIITLPDYTTALSGDQPAFVWASNTSGVMSNTDEGKKLL